MDSSTNRCLSYLSPHYLINLQSKLNSSKPFPRSVYCVLTENYLIVYKSENDIFALKWIPLFKTTKLEIVEDNQKIILVLNKFKYTLYSDDPEIMLEWTKNIQLIISESLSFVPSRNFTITKVNMNSKDCIIMLEEGKQVMKVYDSSDEHRLNILGRIVNFTVTNKITCKVVGEKNKNLLLSGANSDPIKLVFGSNDMLMKWKGLFEGVLNKEFDMSAYDRFGNNICVDCKKSKSDWLSWRLMITLCNRCATHHLKLGISTKLVKVSALFKLDRGNSQNPNDWFKLFHLPMIEGDLIPTNSHESCFHYFLANFVNNDLYNSFWMSLDSSKNVSPDVDNFIEQKYLKKQFVDLEWSESFKDKEDELRNKLTRLFQQDGHTEDDLFDIYRHWHILDNKDNSFVESLLNISKTRSKCSKLIFVTLQLSHWNYMRSLENSTEIIKTIIISVNLNCPDVRRISHCVRRGSSNNTHTINSMMERSNRPLNFTMYKSYTLIQMEQLDRFYRTTLLNVCYLYYESIIMAYLVFPDYSNSDNIITGGLMLLLESPIIFNVSDNNNEVMSVDCLKIYDNSFNSEESIDNHVFEVYLTFLKLTLPSNIGKEDKLISKRTVLFCCIPTIINRSYVYSQESNEITNLESIITKCYLQEHQFIMYQLTNNYKLHVDLREIKNFQCDQVEFSISFKTIVDGSETLVKLFFPTECNLESMFDLLSTNIFSKCLTIQNCLNDGYLERMFGIIRQNCSEGVPITFQAKCCKLRVNELYSKLINKQSEKIDFDSYNYDEISICLIRYLKSLSEPLIDETLFQELMEIQRSGVNIGGDWKLEVYKLTIEKLTDPSLSVLKMIMMNLNIMYKCQYLMLNSIREIAEVFSFILTQNDDKRIESSLIIRDFIEVCSDVFPFTEKERNFISRFVESLQKPGHNVIEKFNIDEFCKENLKFNQTQLKETHISESISGLNCKFFIFSQIIGDYSNLEEFLIDCFNKPADIILEEVLKINKDGIFSSDSWIRQMILKESIVDAFHRKINLPKAFQITNRFYLIKYFSPNVEDESNESQIEFETRLTMKKEMIFIKCRSGSMPLVTKNRKPLRRQESQTIRNLVALRIDNTDVVITSPLDDKVESDRISMDSMKFYRSIKNSNVGILLYDNWIIHLNFCSSDTLNKFQKLVISRSFQQFSTS